MDSEHFYPLGTQKKGPKIVKYVNVEFKMQQTIIPIQSPPPKKNRQLSSKLKSMEHLDTTYLLKIQNLLLKIL